MNPGSIAAPLATLLLVATTLLGATAGRSAPPVGETVSVIVQASDAAAATRLVESMGGTVTHELGIIRAVGARLTAAQRDRLAGMRAVLRLYEHGRVLVDAVDGQTLTVLDEFDQSCLCGDDGTAGWNGDRVDLDPQWGGASTTGSSSSRRTQRAAGNGQKVRT